MTGGVFAGRAGSAAGETRALIPGVPEASRGPTVPLYQPLIETLEKRRGER